MAQATRWTTTYRVPDWLLNDTEESGVGTEWHQDAISSLVEMLREAARRRGASWGVCNQIALQGLRRQDGTAYDPRPDVMVLAQPLPSGRLSSITIAEAGVPLFVAEVASRSTVGNDRGDKRRAYEAIGVPEYVVFDPDGDLLPATIQAWRLEGGCTRRGGRRRTAGGTARRWRSRSRRRGRSWGCVTAMGGGYWWPARSRNTRSAKSRRARRRRGNAWRPSARAWRRHGGARRPSEPTRGPSRRG